MWRRPHLEEASDGRVPAPKEGIVLTHSIRFHIVPRDGDPSTGGIMVLPRPGFRGASLGTIDGNDFFRFTVSTEVGEVVISDEASGP
jgi:hypothetical protein